jgi:Flp pilus assembly protein TadD
MMKLHLDFNGLGYTASMALATVLATSLFGCAANMDSYQDRNSMIEITSDSYGPPKPTTLYAMARILVSQGKHDQGEMILTKIIREFPNFIPAYSDLAELRMRQGRLDDAVQELTAALAVAPRDPIVLNNLGVCSIMKGDYEGALSSFTLAAEVMPLEDRYRANVALCLGMLGHYDESQRVYEEILEPAEAHHNMRVIAEMHHKAQDFFDEPIEIISEPIAIVDAIDVVD